MCVSGYWQTVSRNYSPPADKSFLNSRAQQHNTQQTITVEVELTDEVKQDRVGIWTVYIVWVQPVHQAWWEHNSVHRQLKCSHFCVQIKNANSPYQSNANSTQKLWLIKGH